MNKRLDVGVHVTWVDDTSIRYYGTIVSISQDGDTASIWDYENSVITFQPTIGLTRDRENRP